MPEAPNELALTNRKEKVFAMRIAGFTYRQISHAMTATDDPVSHEMCRRYCGEAMQESYRALAGDAEILRAQAHHRHEQIINRLWQRALPPKVSDAPDMEAVNTVLRTIAQDSRLLGYEYTPKNEVDLRVVSNAISVIMEYVVGAVPEDAIPAVHDALEKGMAEVSRMDGIGPSREG